MLDYFYIFTKGGTVLWALNTVLQGSQAVDALVRTCLLEERQGEASFTWTPPKGSPLTMKWALHNTLGLVFVAVYQKGQKVLDVAQLLQRVQDAFVSDLYQPSKHAYPEFGERFRGIREELEVAMQAAKRAPPAPPAASPLGNKRGENRKEANGLQQQSKTDDDDEDDTSDSSLSASGKPADKGSAKSESITQASDSPTEAAFNAELLKKKKLGKRPGAASGPGARKPEKPSAKKDDDKKKKPARKWGDSKNAPVLDFSADTPEGASSGAEDRAAAVDLGQRSLVDQDDASDNDSWDDDVDEQENAADAANKANGSPAKSKGSALLSSFVRSLGMAVTGTSALTREDIEPALVDLKRKLMERNVAEEIAAKLCESVALGLVGKPMGSFTRVSTAVREAVEAALTRILTPKRSIDVLREIRAKQGSAPYVIVFVGVNGVGKSTNLAKVAYWLIQQNIRPMIAACDTFRSGAVEQLKTHCTRLQVPLYERGYEKDPAKVAHEGIKAAERSKCDVLLVDTAGRMQDNEPLMRSLSSLINTNNPDLVLFVGEALVGNDAVDQLTKFNRRLADLAPGPNAHTIDGIVLTKFDTIDDKVGAAVSMVYTSGAPIMFVGCGQQYVDLKKFSVKSVVRSLLK